MSRTLYAGAARRVINPQLGASKAGMRLFGDPIQAIESDLTGTAVVLGDGETKLVILATDLVVMSVDESNGLRTQVAEALGIPISHVMLNLSHNHSSPRCRIIWRLRAKTRRSRNDTSATWDAG